MAAGYVIVKEDSEERLHLARDPDPKAWALLVGLISLGLGAAFYSDDYLLWKITYVSGAVFVGLSCMEDWEDCIFDKSKGEVEISRMSLIQKLFQLTSGTRVTVASLDEIAGVSVESTEMKFVGQGYNVALRFAAGYSLGITETVTFGDRSDHERIAEKIHKFLELDAKKDAFIQEAMQADDVSSSDNDDDDDDGDFEQISKEDVMEAVNETKEQD